MSPSLFFSSSFPTSFSPTRTTSLTSCCSSSSSSEKPPWISTAKTPTAPWTTPPTPLDLLPSDNPTDHQHTTHRFLTERVPGGRNRRAMRAIISTISRLPPTQPVLDDPPDTNITHGRRAPWTKAEERLVFRRAKKARAATTAEAVLPEEVLVRLREEARGMREWVKAKKAGVTEEVVGEIRKAWRRKELVMVKIVEPLCRNMGRAREIVEGKTGGLVVSSKKDTLVVYRRSDCRFSNEVFRSSPVHRELSPEHKHEDCIVICSERSNAIVDESVSLDDKVAGNSRPIDTALEVDKREESIKGALYDRETNRLLDGLGPRFIDWWHRKPLPVDADLLPETVPNFMTLFRLCPPQVKQTLTDDELTYLRMLAHPLPTHFALGKNTKLQGLASAIFKLWEKSIIAKIAVKIGIQNTDHRQMSSELKRLTGGVLILSNKFYIILYRGNDFLPSTVSKSIFEREKILRDHQVEEEEARLKAFTSFGVIDESKISTTTIGSFGEFQEIQDIYVPFNKGISKVEVQIEAEKENLEKELREQEHRLVNLKKKIENSEEVLKSLASSWSALEQVADQELLTEEERQTFLKIGLKMHGFLLLGRRGIYDGIIGSIYQHWKHREVVKVITLQKSFEQVMYSAHLLEIESGGILVGVEKRRKGHAMIIYRGKNYARPMKLLPETSLTKKQALQRSIEIQRRGSLKFFAYQRHLTVLELKRRLKKVEQRAKDLNCHKAFDHWDSKV